MIPDTAYIENVDENYLNYEVLPTLTYRVDLVNKRIVGKIDEKNAVFQFIKKTLNTDKYAYEIYDWYYGTELIKLVGRPYDYVITELPRIIREALLVDDRIKDVTDFSFRRINIDSMEVSFVVNTVYGTISYELEVGL